MNFVGKKTIKTGNFQEKKNNFIVKGTKKSMFDGHLNYSFLSMLPRKEELKFSCNFLTLVC